MPDTYDAVDATKRLDNHDSLLDVMIQIEDYFDSLDLFVFDNWIEGEIVNGPYVKRYWVTVSLKYPFEKMPDPQGGARLLKYGSKVKYEKGTEKKTKELKSWSDIDPVTKKPKLEEVPVWIVHVKIPRRFIEDLGIEGLDLYDGDEAPVDENKAVEETSTPDEAAEIEAGEGAADAADAVGDIDLEI